MDQEQSPIRWDVKKKEERDAANARADAINDIKRMWIDTLRELKLHPRTPAEVNAAMNSFMERMVARCEQVGDMEDYIKFSRELIEDAIGRNVASQLTQWNIFTPHAPLNPKARPSRFKNAHEFSLIRIVREAVKEGAMLVRRARAICCMWDDGRVTLLGSVANDTGLDDLPTEQEVIAQLEKN